MSSSKQERIQTTWEAVERAFASFTAVKDRNTVDRAVAAATLHVLVEILDRMVNETKKPRKKKAA